MAEVQKQVDSMEEILLSIRDIIAGDEKPEESIEQPAEEAAVEMMEDIDDDDDVMDLSEFAEEAPAEETDILAEIDNALAEPEPVETLIEEVAFEEASPEEQAIEPVFEEESAVNMPMIEEVAHAEMAESPRRPAESLLTEDKAAASTRALQQLLQNIPQPKIESPAFRGGLTLEDLVVEAIKPLLSEWLNGNLPIIVKQMVEREIRKLIPRD